MRAGPNFFYPAACRDRGAEVLVALESQASKPEGLTPS
jgi:hypothetical protein